MVWSCIKMHATHEMRELHIEVNHSCIKMHATHEMRELRIEVNYSCNKMYATRKDSIRMAYGFYRQTLAGYNKKICTLIPLIR